MDGRVRAVCNWSSNSAAEWWTDGLSGGPRHLPLAASRAFTASGLTNPTAFAGFGSRSHTAIVAATSLASCNVKPKESGEPQSVATLSTVRLTVTGGQRTCRRCRKMKHQRANLVRG